jgi:hypothetical protein
MKRGLKRLTKPNKFNIVLKNLESREGKDCRAGIHQRMLNERRR